MKERTVEQLRKTINKYVKKWKSNLFLGMWTINFRIRDYITDDGGSYRTCAECTSSWKYFTADIDFNYVQLKEMEDQEIEEVVIHELIHIVVNELREGGIEHEERIVSHLTMATKRLSNL